MLPLAAQVCAILLFRMHVAYSDPPMSIFEFGKMVERNLTKDQDTSITFTTTETDLEEGFFINVEISANTTTSWEILYIFNLSLRITGE